VGGVNRVAVELDDGDIAFESRIQLSLSVDHRAIDGAAGCGRSSDVEGPDRRPGEPVRLSQLPIRQVAYFCADVRVAAAAHHDAFGSGPFFVADNIPLARSVHRGTERLLDHTSAYGRWAT